MEILKLKYFVHLCQAGTMTKASEDFFMSRQNFSKAIASIEKELDTQLIIRSRTGISLTKAGELFLAYAEKSIADYEALLQDISGETTKAQMTGSISLYGGAIVLNHILPVILNDFKETYPNIAFRIHEGDPIRSLENIARNQEGVGLVQILNDKQYEGIYASLCEDMDIEPILKDEFVCIVGRQHPLARKKKVSLKKFASYPYADLQNNQVLFELVKKQGNSKIEFSCHNISLYLKAITTGKYVGFTAKSALSNRDFYDRSRIAALPFEGDLSFQTALITSSVDETVSTEIFKKYIKEALEHQDSATM